MRAGQPRCRPGWPGLLGKVIMRVGVCTVELSLPGVSSLKGKRSILKSLMARMRQQFNVAVAEVDDNDVWQSAVLGIVCVSNGADYAHGLLTKTVEWLENGSYNIAVVDYHIEMI